MEFFPTHIAMLNAQLPPRYKIDIVAKNESRPRKSEAENLGFDVRFQSKIPEKKPQKEIKPIADEDLVPEVKRSDEVKTLLKIIAELKKNPYIAPFLHPVDRKEYIDYYEKVKEPMDLSTVESKLLRGDYETSYQFSLDMRLIWNNSFFYNANNSHLYSLTLELSMQFERLMKGSENLMLKDKHVPKPSQVEKEVSVKPKSIPTPTPAPVQIPKTANDKPMGYMEKKQLCDNIKKMEPKYLKGVLDIVKECTDIKGEELEFDIDKLPPRVCRELDRYTKNCLQNSTKDQKTKRVVVNEPPRPVQETVVPRAREVEQVVEKINSPNNEVYRPEFSDASSESSSTSESEEEMPSSNQNDDIPRVDLAENNCYPGYGSVIDSFKFY
ncbi:hypothetical protein SteCoe_4892 [Stentor coeruleus]|uniref:Bromo domain-containing protein n=1 Tax=Stentor coeruleus TaxID=5963 RepID=A0A1R2CTM0_9CILI|nr:hypothetical protein SteCoe_4892 [Stentor coeruleus]